MRRTQSSSAAAGTVRALLRRRHNAAASPACSGPDLSTASALSFRRLSAQAAPQTTTPTDTATRSHGQLRLAVVRPDLLDDWIPELNDVDAQTISCSDNLEAVWWRCPRCGARYQSTVRSRVARGRTACPHCSGTRTHTSSSTEAPAAAATSAGSAPLSATHPALAARWDTERNGGLTPSQVTARSSRRVWWRPAASGGAQPSFRRCVFAFVQDASSPWEQAAATASMEWSLLRTIRSAAHIAEAEQLGSLPVRLDVEHIASQSPLAWQDAAELVRAEADAQVGESPSAAAAAAAPSLVTPEDAAAVSLLWKTQVKAQLARSQSAGNLSAETPATTAAAARAAPSTTTPSPSLSAHLDVFGLSSATARHGSVGEMAATTQPHAHRAAASPVREALLNQFVDFVQQKKPQQQARGRHPLPPPVLRLDGAASAAAVGESSWVDFFRLSREDVRPPGYVDPNAALFFSDGSTTTGKVTTRLSREATSKRASAAAPPVPTPATAGEAELVFSYYPRRPSNPPSWEDDIAESLPAAVYDTPDTEPRRKQQQQQEKGRRHGGAYALYNPVFRIEAPFGRSENEGTISSSTASLVREYDDDSTDADAARALVGRDAGAALAAELRGTPSGGAGSLVDSAIAALGSAFATNGHVASVDFGDTSSNVNTASSNSNDRRYRRGVQTPVSALSDRSSRDAVRAAPTKPFHLTMPHEGLGGSLSWRRTFRNLGDQQSAATPAGRAEAAAPPPPTLQFDAPRTPRKVARPRRVRQAAGDAASPAAGEGTE